MQTTHVIVVLDTDPGTAAVYSNESFTNALRDRDDRIPCGDLAREKALEWYWEGGRERTIAGVTFVKAVIR